MQVLSSRTLPRKRQSFFIDRQILDASPDKLKAADIVLFHNSQPEKSPVVHCQRAFKFDSDAAAISHAALYLGDSQVCHSLPRLLHGYGGVEICDLESAIFKKTISVVRYEALHNPSETYDRDDICALARLAEGCPYNYKAVFDLAVGTAQLLINRGKGSSLIFKVAMASDIERTPFDGPSAATDEFLCSDLVFNCYDEVLREDNPLNDPRVMKTPNRLPAEFYANQQLVDVDLSC